MSQIFERKVNTCRGVFSFSYIDYPGPHGMLDVYFETKHLGYLEWMDLNKVSDMDLIYAVSSLVIDDEDDDI